MEYNSQGFHDIEHEKSKPDGTFRVVVLSDSYMEAYSVHFADSFHARLAEEGRAEGVELEVINLGVGGYGTLQEYLLFRDIGRFYEPDLVLLGFFPGNDVADNSIELERMAELSGMNVASRPFLDVESDEDDWRITRVDYEGALKRYEAARKARSGWLRRIPGENSALLGLAWAKLKALRSRFPVGGDGKEELVSLKAELANVGVHRCDEHPAFTRAWGLTRRSLVRLADAVADANARLVVFTVPGVRETDPAAAAVGRRRSEAEAELCFEEVAGARSAARAAQRAGDSDDRPARSFPLGAARRGRGLVPPERRPLGPFRSRACCRDRPRGARPARSPARPRSRSGGLGPGAARPAVWTGVAPRLVAAGSCTRPWGGFYNETVRLDRGRCRRHAQLVGNSASRGAGVTLRST